LRLPMQAALGIQSFEGKPRKIELEFELKR